MTTPTPRTDAEASRYGPDVGMSNIVTADFARQLERELPVWRSIESAPKDGTCILCFWTPKIGPVHAGCFATAMWGRFGWCDPDDDEDEFGEPTHWMPLPPPPKEQE